MRIVITGSSGQIGTNLALALQERGHEVIGIDTAPQCLDRPVHDAHS